MSKISYWKNKICVRCTKDKVPLGEIHCWSCAREVYRQRGWVGPLFGYEAGWGL